ncbi:hypothetical protein HBA54_20865 [Pelagibius litoralis]|uniref:Uncharacterized protein n=1 Tax=Pelagibius litoralis TaxID=374515 RepID=A0A967KF26_9PROT|nr:hypothetical protein [Pelagibius litoralis]NIA71055.1 hypothetical protein [Pelagibius litoralis]
MLTAGAAAGLLLLLSACGTPGGDYDDLMAERNFVGAKNDAFSICHGHGCRLTSDVSLTELEWDPVADIFAEPAASADIERARIAMATAILEEAVGRKTGTHKDQGGTFNAMSGNHQFDCVDETSNTSVYLTLMAKAGYLKWHKIKGWAGRGLLIDGSWPHQSAVVVELKTGQAYAVDTWFEDNGRPAHVVPLEEWRAGWSPPGFVDSIL